VYTMLGRPYVQEAGKNLISPSLRSLSSLFADPDSTAADVSELRGTGLGVLSLLLPAMLLHSSEPYYLWVERVGLMTNKRSKSRLEGWK